MTNPTRYAAPRGKAGEGRGYVDGSLPLIKTDTYGVTLTDDDGMTSVIKLRVHVGGMKVFSQIVQVCGRFDQGKEQDWTSTKERDTLKLEIADAILYTIVFKSFIFHRWPQPTLLWFQDQVLKGSFDGRVYHNSTVVELTSMSASELHVASLFEMYIQDATRHRLAARSERLIEARELMGCTAATVIQAAKRWYLVLRQRRDFEARQLCSYARPTAATIIQAFFGVTSRFDFTLIVAKPP